MSYEHVHQWFVPRKIIDDTLNIIRQVGLTGHEAFVFWAGTEISPSSFQVSEFLFPKQSAQRNALGAWVDIDGEELDRINMYLYTSKLEMPIQVHSHPGEAYHSKRDDEKAIVIFPGSFSMVIPDFGVHPFDGLDDWAVYRKERLRGWTKQSKAQIQERFVITEG